MSVSYCLAKRNCSIIVEEKGDSIELSDGCGWVATLDMQQAGLLGIILTHMARVPSTTLQGLQEHQQGEKP